MKAKVDPDLCIGCELCVNLCPEVFRMEDGKAVAFAEPAQPSAQADCRQAAGDCPVNAISMA
ncbi:MAG TPA: ferredoxin [Elusimicrobia bacterium]|nr:ferredoxin [Elusimicrobiota bacterium]HBT60357.1 ferredoxin [Elusimicrobiota bacterium]